ncbi:hypothetical protein Tco_0468466 [Tanacetum coccineum]
MSNMSEDIQYAGSDTRPPMLDRTDFDSWQQRIRLYCLGKDNGENIMKSITEGPFQMGMFIQTVAEETEGALQLGPERARVFTDLTTKEKERYKADIRATNILLQGIPKDIYTLINHYTDAKDIWDNVKIILEGSKLTKDDRESQLYDEFECFLQITSTKSGFGHTWAKWNGHTFTYLCDQRIKALVNMSVVYTPRDPLVKPLEIWRKTCGDDFHVCRFQVDFRRISLRGFRSCVSRSQTRASQNTMADVNVNAPAEQAPAMAPPTRTNDQILPRIRWVPVVKSNCYLDVERAFTASSTIPSIYIRQFWDTIQYDNKIGSYSCQLDKQWFDLTKDTLRDALQITPVDTNNAFSSPPTPDALIKFVNDLGYPRVVRTLSDVVTNDMFQP